VEITKDMSHVEIRVACVPKAANLWASRTFCWECFKSTAGELWAKRIVEDMPAKPYGQMEVENE